MSPQKNFNRRQLLKKATGIAAGAVAFPYIVPSLSLGKADSAASNRIVMGCIGMGGQGTSNMRAFMGHQDVRVVAVCDVRAERRQKAKDIVDRRYGDKGCAAYNDFRDLLARKDIDAVMIAPPDHWHALMAVAAAQAGKDMYCEKPLGVAVVEAGHKASYLGLIPEIATRLKRKLRWDPATERFIADNEASRMLARPMRSPWRL